MPIQYKIRRGSSLEANSLTLTEGEIYMDLGDKSLRVHDGATQGGTALAKKSDLNSKVDKINITPGTVGSGSQIPVISYNEQGQITAVSSSSLSLSPVATSGSYYDLTDRPSIPNLTSQLMNDAGFIKSTGLAYLHSVSELLNTKTNATGVVVHNMNDGAIWYHSDIAANFTVNLTNVSTTSNQSIGIALVLVQGNAPFIPSALQIDGVNQTINWQDSSAPIGNANKIDVVNFMLIRLSSSWSVLASLSTYG